ncbi:MAG: DUF4837 family protein [Bacteroidota bacterium]
MKYLKILAFILFAALWSCASEGPGAEATTPLPSSSLLPGSYGRPNQVFVIADSTLWNGMVGDSFFYYFAAPYLLLPQPEPIFDIQHMTPEELAKAPAKKEFKSFIFLADMADKSSITSQQVLHDVGAMKVDEARVGKGYTTIVAQNKWALNQQLFYFIGFGPEKLAENISKNFPPVARRINDRDEKMVEANAYQSGTNSGLEADMATSFGIEIKLPGDFSKILHNSNNRTVWLRSDDRDIVSNVVIHRRPYRSEDQLTYDGIKGIRNEVGRIVESPVLDSYMQINDVDLPLFVEKKTLNGLYTVQARGIWEMVNDFKGGAFISNLMLDQDRGELIFVDGFLYAPSIPKKRNYMQELELIISSVEPTAVEN